MNDTSIQLQNLSTVINDSIPSVISSRGHHRSMIVPPRVIPVFVEEISSCLCSSAYRIEHIKQFLAHIDDIFANTKVIDDDVVHLILSLLDVIDNGRELYRKDTFSAVHDECATSLPHRISSSQEGIGRVIEYEKHSPLSLINGGLSGGYNNEVENMTSFHVMRLILSLFDVKAIFSNQCYRAMRRYSSLLTLRRASVEEKAEEESILAAKQAAIAKVLRDEKKDTMESSELMPLKNEDQSAASDHNELIHRKADVALTTTTSPELWMDAFLQHDSTRAMVLELWRLWDTAGIDVSFFTQYPEKIHLNISNRRTSRLRVYRDFVMCTARPKLIKMWGSDAICHIKTNIPARSEIMYRILVEGYNYGVNAVVFSDVVGYTNRNWDTLGAMEKYGWPQGWDAQSSNDYAPGAAISQYFSKDGFVVARLRAKSMYCIGFSASAWLVFHGMGEGYPISATIHHQDADM